MAIMKGSHGAAKNEGGGSCGNVERREEKKGYSTTLAGRR